MQLGGGRWEVTALDKSARRLDRLRENLKRTGLEAQVVAADALAWQPEEPFDAILLDAPCTATGTCRHPDVLHRLPAIEELAVLQRSMLARGRMAAPRWRAGLCGLFAGAGKARRRPAPSPRWRPIPSPPRSFPRHRAHPEGWLRSDPGMLADAGGIDGFFAARWRKV
jgi:16S rRNA (cytosine967-C5)-methyltransferase